MPLAAVPTRDVVHCHTARETKVSGDDQVAIGIQDHRLDARAAVGGAVNSGTERKPVRPVPTHYIGRSNAAGGVENSADIQIVLAEQQIVNESIDAIADLRPSGSIPFAEITHGHAADVC